MKLIPIIPNDTTLEAFSSSPELQVHVEMMLDFYQKVGYNPPWIGYIAEQGGNWLGNGGFKGKPLNQSVEIGYATLTPFRNQGWGKKICKSLVQLALQSDPDIRILARTLPEENPSANILRSNGFQYIGEIWDIEDGYVWEWEYISSFHTTLLGEKVKIQPSVL